MVFKVHYFSICMRIKIKETRTFVHLIQRDFKYGAPIENEPEVFSLIFRCIDLYQFFIRDLS